MQRIGIFVGAIGLLFCQATLSGCTSSGSNGGDSSNQPRYPATAPVAVGPLDGVTWDLPFGEPFSIDPVYAADYSSAGVASNMCEPLLTFDSAGKLQPWL